MKKNKVKFPKKKVKSKSYWKGKAWAMFSKYIRSSRDSGDGIIACYTCGNLDHWKRLQTGHGIEGRNNAVLFMEEVCRPQCVQCNIFKHGNLRIFTLKLIEELGYSKYIELMDKSNNIVQYKVADYQEIYSKYQEKLTLLWI